MNELYQIIEEKIMAAGVPLEIDGRDFYNDVSEEVTDKENGTYIVMIKKSDDVFYEANMEVLEHQFDLHIVDFHIGDKVYRVDFDA